jgi:hypothetical protein
MIPHCPDGIRDIGLRDVFSPGSVLFQHEIRQKGFAAGWGDEFTGPG